jgi:hypothetical protein
MRKMILIVAALAMCTPAFGQTNLLVNPGFSNPVGSGTCGPLRGWRDKTPATGWECSNWAVFSRWFAKNEENDTELINLCPGGPNADGYYGALETANQLTAAMYLYQTVTVEPGKTYRLSGVWAAMSRMRADGRWCKLLCHLQLIDGDVTGTVLKDRTVIVGDRLSFQFFGWDEFTPLIVTPTGTQLTVKIWAEQLAYTWSHMNSIVVDDLVLAEETACTLQPEIDSPTDINGVAVGVISLQTGDRSVPRASTQTLTITGVNFTPDQMAVKLKRKYLADIPGTVTSSTTTTITADFVLPADMALGPWDIVVTGPGCAPAIAPGAVEVYLPGFTNGSFESPAATACTATRTPDFPTDWLACDSGHWRHDTIWGDLYPEMQTPPIPMPGDIRQNFLNLNGFTIGNNPLSWTPTCPADGNNYGTMARLTAGIDSSRSATAFQTFSVTPGQTYTFSGLFAWKTALGVVRMGLLDGDSSIRISQSVLLPTNNKVLANITSGSSLANWRFAYYSVPATTPRMTAFFFCEQKDGTSTEISLHADALSVKPCMDSFTLGGTITPAQGESGKVVQITAIPGSGLVSSPEPPVVILIGPAAIVATNVQVVGGTSIRCQADLTNAPVGTYSVVVMQRGCVDDTSLKDAFQVVQPYTVQLESISPAYSPNGGPVVATLTGTSLEGLSGIKLIRDTGGAEIVGILGPAGANQTERTATFDLTGKEMGRYNVVPVVVGGATPLYRAFLVVAATPSNLSFETGTNPAEPPGGPCVDNTWDRSRALHWDTVPAETSWLRDSYVYYSHPCPQDGDHFAGFRAWEETTLRAFQTFQVTTGQQVDASIYLHTRTAEMSHMTRLILLDGDENGTEVASAEMLSPTTWEQVQVSGVVFSRLATVVIEMMGSAGRASSNVDNVSITLSGGCSRIEVDADNDGDVDQADFAAFQACLVGDGVTTLPETAYPCRCFDRGMRDLDVDLADYLEFEQCATGPGIPLDVHNPPAGCVP